MPGLYVEKETPETSFKYTRPFAGVPPPRRTPVPSSVSSHRTPPPSISSRRTSEEFGSDFSDSDLPSLASEKTNRATCTSSSAPTPSTPRSTPSWKTSAPSTPSAGVGRTASANPYPRGARSLTRADYFPPTHGVPTRLNFAISMYMTTHGFTQDAFSIVDSLLGLRSHPEIFAHACIYAGLTRGESDFIAWLAGEVDEEQSVD
jgi:hypothetical protein